MNSTPAAGREALAIPMEQLEGKLQQLYGDQVRGPRYSQNTRRSFKPRFDYYAESIPQPERRGVLLNHTIDFARRL